MKCSLTLLFLALLGHGAFAQYVEPPWWPLIESTYTGVVKLKQCEGRAGTPFTTGDSCVNDKTCFFGEQSCANPYPDTKCTCYSGTWYCDPVPCPYTPTPSSCAATSTNVVIDFEKGADGTDLPAGAYVKDEWSAHGITISASSVTGFTPDGMPRLFDTANPGTDDNGDPDLGSPNESCSPSGPGVGAGGVPTSIGANCDPQGLVLIIQEEDKPTPDDNADGGMIIFDFAYPTDVNSLGLMDIESRGNPTTIMVTRKDGTVEQFNAQGFGDNSVENFAIGVTDATQVKINFGTSGAVTFLDLCVTPPPVCTDPYSNVVIDFDTAADGTPLAPGAYVQDEWAVHGVTVSAASMSGGFTPDGKPRLFDTTNPGTETNGDPDLGSPNGLCTPSGPGVGTGGVPGAPGANCSPQGLVLIVQESDKPTPDDNAQGGMIIFDFASPTLVNSLGLMDIEPGGTPTTIMVTQSDGNVVSYTATGLGDNSVETIAIGVAGAVRVKITFGTSGAVTFLDLCVNPPSVCTDPYSNVVINFDTAADGTPLAPGAYVQDEWAVHGVTVSASSMSGGFTPDGMPRLFDTADPGINDNGDPDLGSPNESCTPSGPGVGTGGVPGAPGANCAPQGLVLIVQESDKPTPDDNAQGGMIIFDFASPTLVNSLGLMDIESGGTPTTIMVTQSDGNVVSFTAAGLGDNSVETIAIGVAGATQVKITFGTSGAVTFLDLCVNPPSVCTDPYSNVVIDFDTAADGTPLAPGAYVQDEWAIHGVTISASSATGGFTPGGMPRLFDTADPGVETNGDPDLGSPNESCTPSGPGVGAGGVPGAPGANCAPQGLVLIVQESDKPTPDDNAQGGMIIFDFASPTLVNSLGLMDIEPGGTPTTIMVTQSNGNVVPFTATGLGDNSVETIAIGVSGATQVKITFGTSGAVTFLDLCVNPPPVCTDPYSNVVIDFDTAADGTALAPGAYVQDEWAIHGITVSASSMSGGFTPDGMPRLFDTTNPGINDNGDPDLGSPNELCMPSGPGVGAGGVPGAPGANCAAQGLVLIVQEEDKPTPDDNAQGGMIFFDFAYPTNVNSLGLMDIEPGGTPTSVFVTKSSGMVVQVDAAGLGDNSVENIMLGVADAMQVKIAFSTSGAVTFLDLCINPPPPCTDFLLDFETRGDGTNLLAGEYVQAEWSTEYGITISAFSTNGGFTPNDRPRLFNSASPGADPDGDEDLGSPNDSCSPPGLGVGTGGVVGAAGENCDPQGLILIVQESDKPTPDDNAQGGTIVFDFAYPTEVHSVGLMDIENGGETTISVLRTNGDVESGFAVVGLGDNSFQDVSVSISDAQQLNITFGFSGAVTHLDLCIVVPEQPTVAPTCAPYGCPTPFEEVIPKGGSVTAQFCIPTAAIPQNLEMCLLSDATGSFRFDDQPNLIIAAPGISSAILAASPDAKLGYAAFKDTRDDFVYSLRQPLTTNEADWLAAINSLVPDGGGDTPEGQYDGIACAIDITQCPIGPLYSDADCGFSSGTSAKKVIVVTTDAPFSTDSDIQNDAASTLLALTNNDVVLIGLEAFGAGNELEELAMATGGSVVELMSDGSNVADAILEGLGNLTTTVEVDASDCAGFDVSFTSTSVDVQSGDDACFEATFTNPGSYPGTTHWCTIEFIENGMAVAAYSIHLTVV